MAFRAFFERFNDEVPPLNFPQLAPTLSRGRNRFIPIPYNRACKVRLAPGWGAYYHFTYAAFPTDTRLPRFTGTFERDAYRARRRRWRPGPARMGAAAHRWRHAGARLQRRAAIRVVHDLPYTHATVIQPRPCDTRHGASAGRRTWRFQMRKELLYSPTMSRRRRQRVLVPPVVQVSLVAAASWIGYSTLFTPHQLPLPPAVAGERRTISGRAGRLSYYVAGQGAPLLLIHSINAAASAYEMRPLFEHYRARRRVYAVDLPGFGFSDRSARPYIPQLYTDALVDMLDEIAHEAESVPPDALALSLSGEFLARAASLHPSRLRSVALVTSTAFGKSEQYYGSWGETRGNPTMQHVLDFPLWSRAFFDLLTSPPSLRYFLKQTFGSYEAIDAGLLHYAYLTAHQPDAQHAPYAFLSGSLFSADIDRVYESLQLPVWLPYGRRDRFTDFGDTAAVEARDNWTIQAFATGALPHFEQPTSFFAVYDAFLASPQQ